MAVRQEVYRCIKHFKHQLLGLAHRQAAHGIAVKTNINQFRCGFPAQFRVHSSLENTKQEPAAV